MAEYRINEESLASLYRKIQRNLYRMRGLHKNKLLSVDVIFEQEIEILEGLISELVPERVVEEAYFQDLELEVNPDDDLKNS